MRKFYWNGFLVAMPAVLFCWWITWHHPKSNGAWIFANIWFASFTVFVIVYTVWDYRKWRKK